VNAQAAAAAAMEPAREHGDTVMVIHTDVLSAKQQTSPSAAGSPNCSHSAKRGTCVTTQAGIEQLAISLANTAEAAVTAAAAVAAATTMIAAGAQEAVAALAVWRR
jgi:hypothetical protein